MQHQHIKNTSLAILLHLVQHQKVSYYDFVALGAAPKSELL
jgi:hypothetical protein